MPDGPDEGCRDTKAVRGPVGLVFSGFEHVDSMKEAIAKPTQNETIRRYLRAHSRLILNKEF